MIPKELIKKVRKLEIVTRRRVNEQLAGVYHSVFKGRGMDFDEVRPYTPGDDPRTIDWNVSARMNGLYVKRYKEERELTVLLLVDASASLGFGTSGQRKRSTAAELGAILAISAITNNDRVGLVIFTDEVELFVPPKRGRKHVLRVIVEILNYQGRKAKTSLKQPLEFVSRVARRRSVVFLISDFLDQGFDHALSVAARRHDLIPIVLADPAETDLPKAGLLTFQDPETGELHVVDTASRQVRQHFQQRWRQETEQRERMFRRLNMDFVRVRTNESYIEPLAAFFKMRARRH
ncbi:MAG: DUF58 domain-containing protein [Bradymonadales bacterium]|nr:DUF58 domain-containing protein [Bradymonadales bacterium]